MSLSNTVTAFKYDASAGTLKAIQTTDGLPKELQKNLCTNAEIYIHPSGEFLYVSIRGLDAVAAYRIDPQTGRLTLIDREAIRGAHPRSFNIPPEREVAAGGGSGFEHDLGVSNRPKIGRARLQRQDREHAVADVHRDAADAIRRCCHTAD